MKVAVVGPAQHREVDLHQHPGHGPQQMIVLGTPRGRPATRSTSASSSTNCPFLAIDTARVKRKAKIRDNLDTGQPVHQAEAYRSAAPTIVLLFLDPTQGIARLDKQLSDYIAKQYKPCIFVVNKWDLAEIGTPGRDASHAMGKYAIVVQHASGRCHAMPLAFIHGAGAGKDIKSLWNTAHSRCTNRASRSAPAR